MIVRMGKKKKPTVGARSPRNGVQVNGYVPEQIKMLMEQLAKRNHRSFTGEMIVAFENHLRENGLFGITLSHGEEDDDGSGT